MLTKTTLGSYPRHKSFSPALAARPSVAICGTPSVSRHYLAVARASSGVAHPGEESQGDTNFQNGEGFLRPFLSAPSAAFGRAGTSEIRCGSTGGEAEREDMGSGGGLSSVLSPRRMKFVMPKPVIQGPKLADGGDGGDIGKHNHNGGGGGDGDDDDDDYFAEDDDEGDGEGEGSNGGFLRTLIPESFDKLAIACVFAEWMRTVADLPLILRRSVEMGLYSSAQLVRFFSMDVRPSLARSVSRSLPPTWARDFVGRLMADPAFVQKMVVESTFAAALSLWYESRVRGEKFMQELDLALINSMGMALATGTTTWLVAPTRSFGSMNKYPWQQMLEGLPNNVFEPCGPLKHYTTQARVGGFLSKMAELSAVGAITGTATSLLSSAAVELRKRSDPSFEPSVPIPAVGMSSAGLAAYFAVNANSRYQLLGGLDRFLLERSKHLWSYLGISAVARAASQVAGELSRPWWQGLPQPVDKPKVVRRRVARKVLKMVPRSSIAPAPVPLPLPADEAAGAWTAVPVAAAVAVEGVPAMAAMSATAPQAAAAEQPVAAAAVLESRQVAEPQAAASTVAETRAETAQPSASAPASAAAEDYDQLMEQLMAAQLSQQYGGQQEAQGRAAPARGRGPQRRRQQSASMR